MTDATGIHVSDDRIRLGMKAIEQMSDLGIAAKVLLANDGEVAPAAIGVLMDRIEDLLGVISNILEGEEVPAARRRLLGQPAGATA